jgi:hypothetical protein
LVVGMRFGCELVADPVVDEAVEGVAEANGPW